MRKFCDTKNITTFSTNSYQKCRLVVILRGNDSLTYTSKMRKFYNYFLILLYFLYSILLISRLQNYYISSIPANILHKKVFNSPTKLSKTKSQAAHNKLLAILSKTLSFPKRRTNQSSFCIALLYAYHPSASIPLKYLFSIIDKKVFFAFSDARCNDSSM